MSGTPPHTPRSTSRTHDHGLGLVIDNPLAVEDVEPLQAKQDPLQPEQPPAPSPTRNVAPSPTRNGVEMHQQVCSGISFSSRTHTVAWSVILTDHNIIMSSKLLTITKSLCRCTPYNF